MTCTSTFSTEAKSSTFDNSGNWKCYTSFTQHPCTMYFYLHEITLMYNVGLQILTIN